MSHSPLFTFAICVIFGLSIATCSAHWPEEKRDYELKAVQSNETYVFDNHYWAKMEPEKFLEKLTQLQDAYKSGKFEVSEEKMDLVSTCIQLTNFEFCSREKLEEFDRANEKASGYRNMAAFIKWHKDDLKKRCFEKWADRPY